MSVALPPKHVRDNFDRTSIRLHRLRGLLTAIDVLANEGGLGERAAETEALVALIEVSRETLESADHAHTMEWCGLGGTSTTLTADEEAEARGENCERSQGSADPGEVFADMFIRRTAQNATARGETAPAN